jgi:hypothetical protein
MPAAPVPMVVQADTWIGTPQAEGSLFVRKGTVVSISPDNAAMITEYGGAGNLAPLPAGETGDDADHAALEK